MSILDILRSSGDGSISMSKTHATLGFLVATGIVAWYAYNLQLSEWMFVAYMGIALGANSINKKIATDAPPPPTSQEGPRP
ncbi:hypothetical protein ACL2XG_05405 [Sodalis sp. RH24]|uniref:hypothetical protein n=1 Tax=unclassified Sodalis (in: enterobacteria) TaxID=2636512 RepID=UPI0039B59239